MTANWCKHAYAESDRAACHEPWQCAGLRQATMRTAELPAKLQAGSQTLCTHINDILTGIHAYRACRSHKALRWPPIHKQVTRKGPWPRLLLG